MTAPPAPAHDKLMQIAARLLLVGASTYLLREVYLWTEGERRARR